MAVNDTPRRPIDQKSLLEAVRRAARQEQFLEVVSAQVARQRWEAHLDRAPLPAQTVALAQALGRVLGSDVAAPIDVPPFDRSGVDGFAVRSADTLGAADGQPRRLRLNAEVIACGSAPKIVVAAGFATTIATGGMIPRGADAVVMIEHTDLIEDDGPAIEVRRAAAPGQFVAYAGSDIARGETLLRRGGVIGSREIGMLAACGLAAVNVVQRPRVAVLSTGDELIAPGAPLRRGGVYDSNGAILAAAVTEAGGEPKSFGVFPDDEAVLERALRTALAECDMIVLSGGTSKGAGDLSHKIVSALRKARQVRLKKPPNEVRLEIVRQITELLQTEDKVDRAARQKIRSQKREIPEGSEEWDLLLRRYYAEELKKFGIDLSK